MVLRKAFLILILLMSAPVVVVPVFAEEANLPGDASSLRETHGDWTVACALTAPSDGKKVRICAFAQEQFTKDTHQRALAIELRPDNGGAKGTLVLPFGLSLDKGVSYQIDEAASGSPQRFRTCYPQGCLVDLAFDAKATTSLRTAKTLKIKVTAEGGQDVSFSVSLNGFDGAYDRALALLK